MKVLTLTLGPLATNCYLAWQEGGSPAVLIDAADAPSEILDAAEEQGARVGRIVLTHGHADHIEAAGALRQVTGAELAIHELDAPMLADAALSGAAMFGFAQEAASADRLLREGDTIPVGDGAILTVLHTPGHTPGSICLLGDGVLFSGDCLFAGGIGRMDLPGGDEKAMIASLRRLMSLDPDLTVYPGHGAVTTVGEELASNPWLGGW